jgi:hypothetical protein
LHDLRYLAQAPIPCRPSYKKQRRSGLVSKPTTSARLCMYTHEHTYIEGGGGVHGKSTASRRGEASSTTSARLYIYICIYLYICTYTYICIYIYMHRETARLTYTYTRYLVSKPPTASTRTPSRGLASGRLRSTRIESMGRHSAPLANGARRRAPGAVARSSFGPRAWSGAPKGRG